MIGLLTWRVVVSTGAALFFLFSIQHAAFSRPNHLLPAYQAAPAATGTPHPVKAGVLLRAALPVSAATSAPTPAYAATRPPGGLDAATTVPNLWQNATLGQIGAMADGSVQQSDRNQPNGVAGLDNAGTLTAPVTGDLTQATATSALPGTQKRSLAERFAETPSGKDFGLKLDGVTDDTPALQAAKAAMPSGSAIQLPAGKLRLGTALSGTKPTVWQINGATFPDGSPITALGTDVIESTLEGGKYFARGQSSADMAPLLRKDATITHTGGTTGFVMNLEKGNCTIPAEGAALNDYVWCHSTVLSSAAFGAGQHVAQASLAQRPANALADGIGSRSQIWAGYDETRDDTGQDSSVAGSLVGREIDVYSNGDDQLGWRIGLQVQIAGASSSGTPGKVGKGIALGNNDSTSTYGTMIDAAGRFDTAGIDLSGSTPVNNAPVLNIGANRNLAFAADKKPHLQFDSAAYTLRYWYDTANVFSIGSSGDITSTITNAGSGLGWTLAGQAQVGINLTGLSAPEAMRLGTGQKLSWEPTTSVSTAFSAGKLTDTMAAGIARTLDTQGNETLPGALQDSQTIVQLNQPTAAAFVAKGSAAIGLDTTGLSTPDALRLAEGQHIAWEVTDAVKTAYQNGLLQDSLSGAALRSLDTSGNETLKGSLLSSGLTTTLDNDSASAITLTGRAGIGLNLTGLATGNALRLGTGQSIAWEPTAVITTGYAATGLTDSNGGTALRQLDSGGNETLAGTITPTTGLHLPTFSRSQIKGRPGPAVGLVVYDADDDAPAVYTSAGWKLMVLSALP
ncbi:pectate lyase family protein [Acetobacter cibinongensis]|uniref:Uncharacterized protein n=1 Tax=Acetobacter cibinongensis TaxID=146475 RepID=A0A1Z5YXE7_9PROT|nr:hypothetical protein [Acetobacter cibinongensis]OUJ03979.1 hypothetical protein HK14_14865 [Acetobacter cibinongensis]